MSNYYPDKTCEYCSEVYTPTRDVYRRFCNDRCKAQWHNKRKKEAVERLRKIEEALQ